ncbi:hypothetical protein [Enterovibrio calviensis]|uniref:hypothetical protein n=1 Tax=Enterovibrio calviensis TaxID=91359 RepID=UPI0004855015|nr:hypothetical protein [Enterovibrio calviensis]
MDMERHAFGSTPTPSAIGPWGQASTELTGFTGMSHYHLQRLLGDDERRTTPPAHAEWPTSPTDLC